MLAVNLRNEEQYTGPQISLTWASDSMVNVQRALGSHSDRRDRVGTPKSQRVMNQ
jgi:hypothetical protein